MIDAALSMALGFAILVAVFTPLERLFAARRQKLVRPEVAIDLCFFAGQYLVFAAIVAAVLGAVHARLDTVAGLAAPRAWMSAMPVWAQAIVALFLGDFVVYWFHRACHHYDFLWRFHAVHHSAEHLDWLAAHREHPLDGLVTQLLLNLPGIALGMEFQAIGALVVFRGMWAIFIHSNVKLPVGPLRYVFGAPELHHFHHARVPKTEHNFANLAPYLDLAFGTYHRPSPEEEETWPLGLVDPWPRGYLAQLLRPFLPSRGNAPQKDGCVVDPSSGRV